MREFSLLAALSIAAVSAACTLAPHYERPAAPVAATYPTGDAYTLMTESASAPVDLGWRQFFADPRLQKLIELALRNNRDLRVAALNVQQARAQYRVQRAGLVPDLRAQGMGNRSRTPAELSMLNRAVVASQYEVGATAAWEIDLFGKLRSLKDQVLAQYLATAQARKAVEISLVAQLANQYLTTRAYDEQLKVTQATLSAAQESYRLANVQFDAGVGSELDLQEAESTVEQAQANHQNQLRLRAQSENALALLVGESLPADLPQPLPLDHQSLLADIPEGLPSDLLVRRPDIAAAEEKLRAANANIGAARAAFFPSISLTGQFGTASLDLGGLFKPGTAAWGFVPKVSLPIFSGGANLANLDAAQAGKRIAVAQYEKAIQTAFREVADGLAARSTYDEQIGSLKRYTAAQQRRLDLSTLRYRNGIDSYLRVLSAQTSLYAAEQALISSRLARLVNLVNLYQYLGGGWLERTGDTPRPADVAVAS